MLSQFGIPPFLTRLPWWMYAKLVAALLPSVAATAQVQSPFMWGLVLHFFVDFVCQSDGTAMGKAKANTYVLCYHSLLSGGYAGLLIGGLDGMLVSVVLHFIIDRWYKPVVGDSVTSRIVDQVLHVLTLIVVSLVLA